VRNKLVFLPEDVLHTESYRWVTTRSRPRGGYQGGRYGAVADEADDEDEAAEEDGGVANGPARGADRAIQVGCCGRERERGREREE